MSDSSINAKRRPVVILPAIHRVTLETSSNEAAVSTKLLVAKLKDQTIKLKQELDEKTNFVFRKVKDLFSQRRTLEQLQQKLKAASAQSVNVYREVEVFGFGFEACQAGLKTVSDIRQKIVSAYEKSLVDLPDDIRQYGDETVKATMEKVLVSCSGKRVKYFATMTEWTPFVDYVEGLIAENRAVESLSKLDVYNADIVNELSTSLASMAKTATIDEDVLRDTVSSVNVQCARYNELLNACYLLQSYNRIVNIVTIDALRNLS